MLENIAARIAAFIVTPLGQAALLWVFVSVATLVFKPRTPEEYAKVAARAPSWLWSRWAALWQMVGGLGLDPLKVAAGMLKLFTGGFAMAAEMQRGTFISATFEATSVHDDDDSGSGGGPPAEVSEASTLPAQEAAPPSSSPVERRAIVQTALAIGGAWLIAMAAMLAAAALMGGCNAQDAKTAKDVTRGTLSVIQRACIVANSWAPKSKVAEVCGVSGPLLTLLDDELASARAAGVSIRRPFLVTCDDTDAGVVCGRPYLGTSDDAGVCDGSPCR